MTAITPEEIISILELEPLPEEGGMFRQTFIDANSTAIYFLLAGDDFSALHVLTGPEAYHFYAGAPVDLQLLHPDGTTEVVTLGTDLAAGQRPQYVVKPGIWQGSSSRGEWSLLGTTMAPTFDWEGFRLGDRAELSATYPDAAEAIGRLTRVEH